MKKLPLVSAIAASLIFSAQSADFTPYIVNGDDVSVTTYPSIASLFIDRIDYDGVYARGSYCGATVLDDMHILTAAHCIYGDKESQLFTAVVPKLQNETDFPHSIVEKAYIKETYYPDTYNKNTSKDDIAILKLSSPLTTASNADYIVRPNTGDDVTYRDVDSEFYAVGHGNTRLGFDTAISLQQAKLTYVSNNLCNYTATTDTNLCMEGVVPSGSVLENGTCHGDSGGPLYWYDGTEYIQVGITSFGPSTKCGDPDPRIGATSVFTELHDYNAWVNSVLAGNETPKFIATESEKQSFLSSIGVSSNSPSDPSAPPSNPSTPPSNSATSSSSGGGSIPLWSLLLLPIAAFLRRK